jgi:preprotein translocase subunit YajC
MNRYALYTLSVLTAATSTFAMAPAEGQEGGNPFGMLFLIVGIFAIMYFFMIRPQKKQQQKKQEMINTLKPGDKIMTTGGIYGEVKQIKEGTIRVQIDDHARIEIAKSAVATVVTPEETEAK